MTNENASREILTRAWALPNRMVFSQIDNVRNEKGATSLTCVYTEEKMIIAITTLSEQDTQVDVETLQNEEIIPKYVQHWSAKRINPTDTEPIPIS